MKKAIFLLYGVFAYVCFVGTFVYAVGFVGNIIVPKTIDGTPEVPLLQALLTNTALLLLFALQHSIMARPAFKRWWTKFVPEPIERSTFVLLTCVCLGLMMSQWQPMGGVIWSVESPVLQGVLMAVYLLGYAIVLVSSFLINHFDLFGLRQVWLYFQGKPYTNSPFRTPFLYKAVRHPLYMGFIIAFWATPLMTVTHLLFALATTGYILTAIQLEERDLITQFGDRYRNYRRSAPMLIPFLKKRPIEQVPSDRQVKAS